MWFGFFLDTRSEIYVYFLMNDGKLEHQYAKEYKLIHIITSFQDEST